jgi:hypothetical protein
MSSTIKQAALAVVLVGLIGAVLAFRYYYRTPNETSVGDVEAVKRYGFALRESAKESGIDFHHQSPTLDKKLDRIMPIVSAMSASVSVVDFDRDGLLDFYVVNSGEGSKNALYRNLGNGQFKDVAEELGIADLNKPGTGCCTGAVWGDFDNDGYEDLLVYKWGKPELYHNDKGKGFTLVKNSGLPEWVNANSAIWLDFDRDGKLDLFIAGYWDENLDLWHLNDTKVMPESFEYANDGGRKYLLRNRGDGTFEDVTEKVGIKSRRWTLAVAAADLCGSGYPDLFLANDYGVSEVYANRGGKEFVEIGKNCDIGAHPKSGMNVTFGDVYNKGFFSAYVSNISEPRNLVQGNNLWVPKAGTAGEKLQFENRAGALDIEHGGWSWGAQFGDLNNDGLLDLFLTNGYVSANKTDNYWYEYSLIAGGSKVVIRDAKNWPEMKGRSLSGYQTKCLWWNKGGGKMVDIARVVGVTDTFDGRSVALADLGNRGALDVLVATQNGPLLLYRNTVDKDNQWVQFDLEGTKSNRSAIGARVRLFWKNDIRPEGQQQIQDVSGGNGYASQNMRRLHFGLGKNAQIEKAVIRWPSGRENIVVAPAANTCHKIQEPTE